MLDHPEKTPKLMAALKAAVPFEGLFAVRRPPPSGLSTFANQIDIDRREEGCRGLQGAARVATEWKYVFQPSPHSKNEIQSRSSQFLPLQHFILKWGDGLAMSSSGPTGPSN
jgi:hypothetical protein